MTDEPCGACVAVEAAPRSPGFVYADELWVVRHSGPPYPAIGWLLMHARRHVAGISYLNDREAAELGPTLRRITAAQVAATGALRVYVASLTEATPHFHFHLVPRYEGGPTQWAAFNDLARARTGDIPQEPTRVAQVIETLRGELSITKVAG